MPLFESATMASWFTDFDLHPKLEKEFAVRTRSGGLVSLAALAVAALLFVSELRLYLTTEKVEHMEVDDAAAGGFRGGAAVSDKTLRINFDVTFPALPCALLSLDALDASGANSVDVIHNVFKRRLDSTGLPLGEGLKEGALDTLRSTEELLREKRKAIAEGRPVARVAEGQCGDCYGAAEAGVCCNTCEEVREVYKKKGWQFVMKGVKQCEVEGFYGDVQQQLTEVREYKVDEKGGKKARPRLPAAICSPTHPSPSSAPHPAPTLPQHEGCNAYGSLEVPKVPGNFHFGPSQGAQSAYQHVADVVAFTYSAFNVTHRVNSLSFGPYLPGDVRRGAPLDGRSVVLSEGTGMHQYFIKLVPLVYAPLRFAPVLTYQFSVTEHVRKLDASQAQLEAA